MDKELFQKLLEYCRVELEKLARLPHPPFDSSPTFETAVRKVADAFLSQNPQAIASGLRVDMNPPKQGFPDIVLEDCGIEVKYTESNNWRTIANSVRESDRVPGVTEIFVMEAKMGGTPEVKYRNYGEAIIHVRSSHDPRFEVDVTAPKENSLFSKLSISYEDFSKLDIRQKMYYVRTYARKRIATSGEYLWWIEDNRFTTSKITFSEDLKQEEKDICIAEVFLIAPEIFSFGKSLKNYQKPVSYLLEYRGVVTPTIKTFAFGNPYIDFETDEGQEALKTLISKYKFLILKASKRISKDIFIDFWGEYPADPMKHWFGLMDHYTKGWDVRSLF